MLLHPPLTATESAPIGVRATSRRTRFSLAANYDPDLVPQLAGYPVDEVYGKFPADGISGGRPRYLATPISETDLRFYIRLLDQHGIAFNYLLNGACFSHHEWTRSWQKRVTALLAGLAEMGVRRVTVSTPFLLELIKRRFDGNLAELLLSYGFKQPARKESLWSLRHFWKPQQVNPRRLKPLLDLARLQGWLSPLPECPIRVEAPRLAARALDAALTQARLVAGQVDALLICTCTGYLCPGVTSYVAEQLGLRADAFLQDLVGLGCGAAIPCLRAADAMLAAQPAAVVACVAVEVCSAAFYLDDDPGVLVSACLFGDGAPDEKSDWWLTSFGAGFSAHGCRVGP